MQLNRLFALFFVGTGVALCSFHQNMNTGFFLTVAVFVALSVFAWFGKTEKETDVSTKIQELTEVLKGAAHASPQQHEASALTSWVELQKEERKNEADKVDSAIAELLQALKSVNEMSAKTLTKSSETMHTALLSVADKQEKALAEISAKLAKNSQDAHAQALSLVSSVATNLEKNAKLQVEKVASIETETKRLSEMQLAKISEEFALNKVALENQEKVIAERHAKHLDEMFDKLGVSVKNLSNIDDIIATKNAEIVEMQFEKMSQKLQEQLEVFAKRSEQVVNDQSASSQKHLELMGRYEMLTTEIQKASHTHQTDAAKLLESATEIQAKISNQITSSLVQNQSEMFAILKEELATVLKSTTKDSLSGAETAGNLLASIADQVNQKVATQSEEFSSLLAKLDTRDEGNQVRTKKMGDLLEQKSKDWFTEQQKLFTEAFGKLEEAQTKQSALLNEAFVEKFQGMSEKHQALVEKLDAITAGIEVGGAELEAASKMFVAAVGVQREASDQWLSRLKDTQSAMESVGHHAASDVLQRHFEQFGELFAKQLSFHRELYDVVKTLRDEKNVHELQKEETLTAIGQG